MKPSFDSFVTSFPTNKVIQHSSSAKHIYDEIIWDDDVRIKFVEASENGRPALSACAKQVEDYCLNDPTCDLDLSNDTVLRIGSNSAELEKCHRPHCPLNLFCSIPFGSNLLQLLVQRELL